MTVLKTVRLADGTEFELDAAFTAIQNSGTSRLSDDDAVFFQRQLEFIEAETYDTLYPELEAREAFDVDTSGGPGINTLTFRSYNHVGSAQVINARSTDLPKSSISGKEYSVTVKTVGTAFDYDVNEIQSAQVTGLPLETRKANAATRGYEQYINSAAWYGDEANGFVGFLQHPEITRGTVAPAVGGNKSTVWGVDKTPDEVIADLTTATAQMYASTLKIMRPEEIWMSVEKEQYIFNTPRSTQSDTSIGNWFLANNIFIKDRSKICGLNALRGQGQAGSEVFVVICRLAQGRKTFRLREPLPLTWQPVQLHGLIYEVPGYGRFAGFQAMYPAAISINSGI